MLGKLPRFGGSLIHASAFRDHLEANRHQPGHVSPALRGPLLALLALVAAVPLLFSVAGLVGGTSGYVRILEAGVAHGDRLIKERRLQEALIVTVLVTPSEIPLERLPCGAILLEQEKLTSRLKELVAQARLNASDRKKHMPRIDRLLIDQIFTEDVNLVDDEGPLDKRTANVTLQLSASELPGHLSTLALISLLFVPVCCVLSAMLFRGGLRHYILGVRLVRRDGRRAGRLRCGWRALTAWTFLAPLALWPLLVENARKLQIAYLGDLCWVASGLLTLLFFVVILRTPARSLHDRLAGTWLVPR
jgi:hypothetical protein